MTDPQRNDAAGPEDERQPLAMRTAGTVADVLIALATRAPLSVREMANEVGTSKSTAHRIVAGLEVSRLVEQDPVTRLYRPGLGALRLATAFVDRNVLIGAAKGHMVRLASATSETVVLSEILDGARIVVHKIESQQELRYDAEVGGRYPLDVGSSSRMLLASLPPEELEKAVTDALDAPGVWQRPDRSSLLAAVEESRAKGLSVSREEMSVGGAACAVAISGAGRPASLGIYCPVARFDSERESQLLDALRATARDIDDSLRLLGHSS